MKSYVIRTILKDKTQRVSVVCRVMLAWYDRVASD